MKLDADVLRAHLERCGIKDTGGERAEELFLACAAAHGDRTAVATLEREFVAGVLPALARLRGPSTLTEDVRQQLLERLLMSTPGKEPKLLLFAGRSDLATWLRAVAMRIGLDLMGDNRRWESADDEFLERSLPIGEPGLNPLKQHDARFLKDALKTALEALPKESKELIHQYYLEGLGVEALGAVHRVNASTISRRIAKARETLLADVRRELARRLRLSGKDADSLIRAVVSQLEVSRLSSLL